MSEMMVDYNDIAQNNEMRTVLCLVVDNSYSMTKKQRLKMVNEKIRSFIKSAYIEPTLKKSLEICIVAGDAKGSVIVPFTPISKIHDQNTLINIKPNEDYSTMIEGVQKGLSLIDERMDTLQKLGAQTYSPFLYIISDGESPDYHYLNTAEGSRYLKDVENMRAKRDLKVKAILISDEENEINTNNLKIWRFDRKYDSISELETSNLVRGLSREISAQSKEIV